ncbi:putative ribonuclease H-like domain-containing protein [Tanacetum coccineum]
MQNLERQLNKETLYEKDSKSALSVIKVQFDKFLHSEAVKPSHYDGRHERENFKDYTQMEAQTFKEKIIQNMDSIEQCIIERARHEQEIQNRLKMLNERKLLIQECKIQEVKALDASPGDKDRSGIVSGTRNDQCLENQSNTSGDESSRTLGESNRTRDRYLVALHDKEVELVKYKTFKERTIENDTLERKLREIQAVLDQKEHDIKEATKASTYNGRTTFANPMYLKKAQSEKPCLYEIPYDTYDLANIFAPDRKETLTLKQENFDAYNELQCLYLHKIKECECLAEKLSKQTETVSKEVYNELLRSFAKLEHHSISIELALQQCQEQMKNDTVCKQNGSTIFLKEREQYHEIQDLKAQLQDKNIAISELKKLIEKIKGKGVDTNFEKQSILGKLSLQPIRNQPVLRQLTAYKSERFQVTKHRKSSFAKLYDVNAPGPSRNRIKHVSFQSPRESVGSNDMIFSMAGEDEFHDDNPPPPPPPVTPAQQAPHTLSTIKHPILKKGEYDTWAMKMEHYLGHTDYPIWEVIQMGNGLVQVSTDTNGQIRVLSPKTAKEILARERERKARTTLLMSIPEDHLAKFHKMTDAKEMWEAIKSRFGGNDESKKMQKYILKQQFESFSVSNSEGLHKGYDRFQSLLSQLEIHGAGVSTEDANQKFLRSLPASWSQVSLIMRTKPGVDTLSFDDLYNNLRVFESDVKGSTASSSSTQNVAFVSSESTSSTNDVSTAYGVSTSSGHNSQKEGSSSYTDELKYSFFANQSSGPQLDHEDLEQVDEFDLEEMDLKWQVAMISMRLKKFYKNTGRKLYKRQWEETWKQEQPKALVTIDGDGVDWTGHAKDEQENFALMAYNNSGSNTEKLLAEAVKEKEELKTKLENFQSSSKGLSKLLNSQMSAKDKSGLGYGDQIHEGVLSYENEVLESVFDSRSSDVEDSPVYDRFAKVEGMHAVPPPMTRIYMPPKSDFGIDESNFTYETLESVPKPAVNEPKAVSKPKVWSDAPIIEEYESDSDDEYVIKPSKEQEKPSFAFVNTVKHVKTPRETVKEQNTCSPSPKADKRDWNGLMSKKLGLGYGFTKKACFVCGSFSHLIRDCDFHEKRMAKQVELNKQKGKGTGQGENRPVWNNVQRLNHQNKFVPKAVLTKTSIFPVNAARQNPSSQAAETSTARKVNTARPIVNEIRQRNNFYKSHSPIRRPFNKSTAPKANFTNHKVNTVGDKTVSVVRGYWETVVKASIGCNWRPKRYYWNKVSKYNSGSNISKHVNFKDLLGRPKHMTGNKAYLVEYQDYNGGPVAFGGSKGQITGKGKIITGKLDFEDVYFVKELKQFNLFSVSQMCDKKNKVLFMNLIQKDIIEFCGSKGIKREYSNARTPEQNGVAERKNRTLIEAARTMLADSFLPNTF